MHKSIIIWTCTDLFKNLDLNLTTSLILSTRLRLYGLLSFDFRTDISLFILYTPGLPDFTTCISLIALITLKINLNSFI